MTIELEERNADLASLYVATHRIHSSLESEEVLAAIEEVIVTLLGSEELAIFARASADGSLSMLRSAGVSPSPPIPSAILDDVLASGKVYVRAEAAGGGAPDGPVICIPLKVGERVTGAIVIYSLLSHKNGLSSLDYQLCDVLSTHGGSAIYASGLHERAKAEGWSP